MAGTITIKYCDIEKIPTECIVNAANDGLHYGTGVCHAVFTGAGMAAMTEACNSIGHCDVGKAIVTKAFDLPADWVIHAVGPYTSQENCMELLRSAYLSAMAEVKRLGCHKVTFPLISSGAFNDLKISYEPLWNTAISAIQDFQATYPDYPIDVLFACHGHQLIDVGQKVLAGPPAVHVLKTSPAPSAEEITRHRIYVAKMGGFRDSVNYEFIAEFESKKLTGNYIEFMRGKKRYSDKDIIVQEVLVSKTPQGETITKGKVVSVITVIGEELPVDEYEFK